MQTKLTILLSLVLCLVSGFLTRNPLFIGSKVNMIRKARSENGGDPLAPFREKMNKDPNYNVFEDPKAMQVVAQVAPKELLEMRHAIDRLAAVFKDATQGDSPIPDLDAAFKSYDMTAQAAKLSAPQSNWFKQGLSVEWEGSNPTQAANEAIEQLKSEHPSISL